ncbi:hypothetical protein MRQ36_23195 [Micromonospora sp. R77]|uniref:hypothetical protein n=1 Tax=Micromonospora sp. R77 TaxID=2925836 RepID=UPI001F60AD49|nr:hypothetical protein [Micromonospora sp. R77]MCI4065316.1 hypothetical protein [Micromonospora sp. R77]
MDADGRTGAERRVWAALPTGTRAALAGLPGADLRTALLAVAGDRAAAARPADVVRRWREDRFVRPADVDPRALSRVEGRLWELLPADVAGVELSPVAPLGTCAAVAPVSQHRIVSTMRGTEVVSDPTNALAVEAAVRRQHADEVHLAAAHRVLRAQDFGPGASAHFRLFTLVSTARDTGSGRTEARLLVRHLAFWHAALADLGPTAAPRLRLTVLDPVLGERLADTVRPALSADGVPLHDEPERQRGRGYYRGAALRLTLHGDALEVGDGGFTDWTARLTGDAKERCLISCLATERLTGAADG